MACIHPQNTTYITYVCPCHTYTEHLEKWVTIESLYTLRYGGFPLIPASTCVDLMEQQKRRFGTSLGKSMYKFTSSRVWSHSKTVRPAQKTLKENWDRQNETGWGWEKNRHKETRIEREWETHSWDLRAGICVSAMEPIYLPCFDSDIEDEGEEAFIACVRLCLYY